MANMVQITLAGLMSVDATLLLALEQQALQPDGHRHKQQSNICNEASKAACFTAFIAGQSETLSIKVCANGKQMPTPTVATQHQIMLVTEHAIIAQPCSCTLNINSANKISILLLHHLPTTHACRHQRNHKLL